ncbi:MAG: ATP-binding protein, partial [Chitinophagaceae bacterium]|nr:ATP-binding protein [Chitinophagaceae bacterium]
MAVKCEPPLSICRIQWLDVQGCIPIDVNKVLYKKRFERLVQALEHDQLDFEGVQKRLLNSLKPLDFGADIISHTKKFTGRQWVFDAIDRWLREATPERVFWISGEPGIGKTAISAELTNRYSEIVAIHFCKFAHSQKSSPRHLVLSIIYQLTTQLPEYEGLLATLDIEDLVLDDATTIFDNLLVQQLVKLSPPDREIVILIDALDEATKDGRNELASFISAEFLKTPSWLRLIITSRPEKAVTSPMTGLNPFILKSQTEANNQDIRRYLMTELKSLLEGRTDAKEIIEHIVVRSEGIFLYVDSVAKALQTKSLSIDNLEEFPKGLGGVYWQFFERQFPNFENFKKEIRPALRIILAGREPLPIQILQDYFNWKEDELRDFIRSIGSLFTDIFGGGKEVIQAYHKSLSDWLTTESMSGIYYVSKMEGDKTLADLGWNEFKKNAKALSSYFVNQLPVHLLDLKQVDKIAELLLDFTWIQEKTDRGLVYELLQDYKRAIDAFPAKHGKKSA